MIPWYWPQTKLESVPSCLVFNSSLNIWLNSPAEPSGFCWNFFDYWINLFVIGLFTFSVTFWDSFGSLFREMCTFHVDYLVGWYRVVHLFLYNPFIFSKVSSNYSHFNFWFWSFKSSLPSPHPTWLVSVAKVFIDFSLQQLWVLLIFSIVFLFSISFFPL